MMTSSINEIEFLIKGIEKQTQSKLCYCAMKIWKNKNGREIN